MAIFKWIGGSVAKDQGRYQIAADWVDVSTGTSGVVAPAGGDTAQITGVRDTDIHRQGALYEFPVGGGYTQVLFYAPPTQSQLQSHPNSIVGYTVADQTIDLRGTAGPVSLWLQNSHLVGDTIAVLGTAIVNSYLDSSIAGTIGVGTAGTGPGFLQIEPIPADTAMIAPGDHVPVTTLDAALTIGAGSTFDVEAAVNTTGFANDGTILVKAGGTLIFDDVDDPHAVADVNNDAEVDYPFNNDLLVGNGGTISVQGAASRATRAVVIANTQGPGTIIVAGNGAPPGATSLSVDGNMDGQSITLSDGVIRFNDAQTAIGDPGLAGFNVTGGAFDFADAHGTLVLNQAALTMLAINKQVPDNRMPFTTPISGFGRGDAIELVGKYQAGLGLSYGTVV